MESAELEQEILGQLHRLPPAGQQQVLAFVRTLAASSPQGMAGREMLQFAGMIEPDELSLMKRAIETGCERIDHEEW